MVFYLFSLSVGARAQVSFFLPNFDVIRTKQAEMEPVLYKMFWAWQDRVQILRRAYRVFEFF